MDNQYSGPQYSNSNGVENGVKNIAEAGSVVDFNKYGLIACAFAIVYTVCLFENHAGSIMQPVFMLLTFVLLYFLRKKEGLSILGGERGSKAFGVFYIVSLMLLSVHKCMTTNRCLIWFDSIAIFLLFFSYLLYLYFDTRDWDISGWISGMIMTIVFPLSHLSKPFADLNDWSKSKKGKINPEQKKNVSAVIIGVICAIPVLLIVVLLLSTADVVFADVITRILKSIHLPDNIGDIFALLCSIILAFWAAYLVPFVLSGNEIKVIGKKEGTANPVMAITFTAILGSVYLLFCAVQVMVLFMKTLELPDGYTYAKYAHEGFYQLLTVCIINILMVAIITRQFKKSKVLNIFLMIIVACTYIMVASTAMRMLLYIRSYNFTLLRLLVLWFLAVVCFLLAFLIIGIFKRSFPVFKASMVLITVAYMVLVFSNPDYQIAKYDMAAVDKTNINKYEKVESYILEDLSTDAINAIKDDKELLHGFELYTTSKYRYEEENYEGLRHFNFSYNRAKQIFDEQNK